jgi:carbon-monoxide dehydrogenase small subunit
MMPIRLIVNGRPMSEMVEPRTHLADLLREKFTLTGTHLRCEQGVCGACTVLIDGEPARTCITYAVLCEGASITTIEGLADDPVVSALRRAFTAEHGLQCGFCTPAMLITARDIVIRLPDADEKRVRIELAGNLCRCTGYVGIVRAIRRVLQERKAGALAAEAPARLRMGPVGSGCAAADLPSPSGRGVEVAHTREERKQAEPAARPDSISPELTLGLGSRQPNIELQQSFTVARPQREVWDFLSDVERVVPCMPGATLRKVSGDRLDGQIAIKLGPITASFSGEARVIRDASRQRGMIAGSGRDRLSASRAGADIEYALVPLGEAATRVDISIRALLSGPLAQFGRSGIVDDLAARLTATFAHNLEARLAGRTTEETASPAPLRIGALIRAVVAARIKSVLDRWFGRRTG